MSITATDKVQAVDLLRQVSDSVGKAWDLVVEGDAAGSRNKAAVVVGKRVDGSMHMPRINANNELVVSTETDDYACLNASEKVAGSIASEQTVITITLTNSSTIRDLALWCSCARRAEYRVVVVEDVGGLDTETELGAVLLNQNSGAFSGMLPCSEFTVPAADVNELRVYGMNHDAASDLRASVSMKEIS